jgi:hypothetical protein
VLPGIEMKLKEIDVVGQPTVQIFTRGERVELFQQQRGDQGKQAHGK